MHFPRAENKVNWTTAIALVGLLITGGGYVYAYGQFTAKVSAMETGTAATAGRTDARLSSLEGEAKKIDNLAYRMTLVEQNNVAIAQKLDAMSRQMTDQGADVKVIREILSRIDQDRPPK